MMGKYIIVGSLVVVGLLTMNVAMARGLRHHEEVDVDINEAEELVCGAQQMDFSGYVDLHDGHALVVELDGSEITTTINGTSWWTGLHQVGVGNHDVYAYVTNSGNEPIDDLWEFTIEECPTSTSTPTPTPTPSDEPKDEGSNDPGDEQDCETSTNADACGEGYTNEEPETPAPVARVKGVEKKATPTPTPIVAQKLEKLPAAGPSMLLPLMLVSSWLGVAIVGFKKKW